MKKLCSGILALLLALSVFAGIPVRVSLADGDEIRSASDEPAGKTDSSEGTLIDRNSDAPSMAAEPGPEPASDTPAKAAPDSDPDQEAPAEESNEDPVPAAENASEEKPAAQAEGPEKKDVSEGENFEGKAASDGSVLFRLNAPAVISPAKLAPASEPEEGNGPEEENGSDGKVLPEQIAPVAVPLMKSAPVAGLASAQDPEMAENASTATAAAPESENAIQAGSFLLSAESGQIASEAVTYNYNAALYDPESGDYPGVYSTALQPNSAAADEAPTIGLPSIADQNLDVPTTESPAIIQGAALGYEEKTGQNEYETLKERVDPYTDYTFQIMEETGSDGTVHKKITGFDGTYVIVRLDVSSFFSDDSDDSDDASQQYLHMKQEQNMALVPGMGMADNEREFTTQQGNRTASYLLSDLADKGIPYMDVLLFATAKNVAGADIGKENMPDGDVKLQLYVDDTADYNPDLKYDPQSTDPQHEQNVLAKFFDAAKGAVSSYLIKGSDLALEVAVEDSGGENKDTGTTYWSLKKAFEDPYYDQEEDRSPDDPGSGRTLKLISEVAVTDELVLEGTDKDNLRKRTLDVNSFDVQVANNTTQDEQTYSDGFTLKNAWLTIEDKSNTTGAEMAIGNNARFVIDEGGKLIIDETCQLEIEWDGGTTQPGPDGTMPEPDILNNGVLDLRPGGEIENNGIITIEGFEGKPYAPGQEEQAIDSDKGCGELTIEEGATLTNNGCLIVYGKLYNLGRLVNNGRYSNVIVSNDPDKGQYAYHKGIQVSWKDDVTQKNVYPGALYNGKDRDGNIYQNAVLENNGDILLNPGTIENYMILLNGSSVSIWIAAATEAIIPIEPTPEAPSIYTKRIVLDPPKASSIENYGTLVNNGRVTPASVVLNDNGSFGAISEPGSHPELFGLNNYGSVVNNGYIYGWPKPEEGSQTQTLIGLARTEDGTWLYLYSDSTFLMILPDGTMLTGTYTFTDGKLIFALKDGTTAVPAVNTNGDFEYSFTTASGLRVHFVLIADYVASVREKAEKLSGN